MIKLVLTCLNELSLLHLVINVKTNEAIILTKIIIARKLLKSFGAC